jgi:hypothetical protein
MSRSRSSQQLVPVIVSRNEALKQLHYWYFWARENNLNKVFCEFIQKFCLLSQGVGANSPIISYNNIVNYIPNLENVDTYVTLKGAGANNLWMAPLKKHGQDVAQMLLDGFKSIPMPSKDVGVFEALVALFHSSYLKKTYRNQPLENSIQKRDNKRREKKDNVQNVRRAQRSSSPSFMHSSLPVGSSSPVMFFSRENKNEEKRSSSPSRSLSSTLIPPLIPLFLPTAPRVPLPRPVAQKEISFQDLVNVVKQLRHGSDCGVNCSPLTKAMIAYFSTGIKPSPSSVPDTFVNEAAYDIYMLHNVRVKKEGVDVDAEDEISSIPNGIDTRGSRWFSFLGPKQISYGILTEEKSSTTEILTKDECPYTTIHYKNFEKWALNAAEERDGNAYGTIIFRRMGQYVAMEGHTLSWFASVKNNCVLFIEPQRWNGKTNTGETPVYTSIEEGTEFYGLDGNKPIGPNTFYQQIYATVNMRDKPPVFIVGPPPKPVPTLNWDQVASMMRSR